VNERPVEYRFALEHLSDSSVVKVLDVGTGTTAWPHLLRTCGYVVTSIDNVRDYWKGDDFSNRHYHVIDEDILAPTLTERFDFITCISVLEHIPQHDRALESMFALLNDGGLIGLTFPYDEQNYIDNVYKLPGSGYGFDMPYVCQVYSRTQINGWLSRNHCTIVHQEYWRMFTGKYWTFGDRLRPPVQVDRDDRHQLTCVLLRKGEVSVGR
jgi:SAM-dependent methyltransferase